MPKYKVFVAGNCPVHTETEVEADNAEKAAEIAVRQASTDPGIEWLRPNGFGLRGYEAHRDPGFLPEDPVGSGIRGHVENIYAAGVKLVEEEDIGPQAQCEHSPLENEEIPDVGEPAEPAEPTPDEPEV